MKIFLSMKAPQGNKDQRTASFELEEAIRSAGHEPFVAWKEIEQQGLSPQLFMPFVRDHLRTCQLLLVLYHPDLRGGLIELGIAYACGVPIWLAHSRRQHVSSSAMGCADLILEFATQDDLRIMILDNLHSSAFS
jgi:hypothetical protein